MNDKLKKLYDLYVESGIIQTSSFEEFASVGDQQRKKLYDLGKQNGLFETTDYNSFNSVFNVNAPVKKKSTTGSQSVQKKKPTSSVTPVSWMQESLVSSSSQEQKKKPTTKTTEAPVVARKETVVEQVIPGQEQTRMNNGKLERLYNGIWVDASTGGREVGTISKSVQQSRKEDANIFTGYPGKEKNEYRVYNDVWQRRQPGKKEWTTIINDQSVNALNKQFNKEVKVGSNINVQLRRDSERKELDNRLATVSSKLIDQEEDAVIKNLKRQFPNFKFIEEGTFTDEILVVSPDGNDRIKISLDNWTFDDDRAEAVNLREFIRKNSNNDLNESERKEIEAKKDREYFDVKPFYPTIQIGDGYGDEKIVTDPSQISTEPKQKMNIMTADQNLKVATKEYAKEYANAFLDVQERARISAKTEGKLDDKEVSAAYASLDHNVKTAKIADRYFQDVSAQSKELKKQFSDYSSWVDSINERAKAGDISKEEYENTYVPQMKEELERLKGMSTQLNDEYSTSNNMLKSVEKATAENYIIQESKGSFGGGVAYNFTKGLTDIARIATFGNFDAKDQEAIVRLIVGEGTTKEYMSSENRSDLTKVLFSLATSLGQAASGGIVGRGVAAIGGGTKAVLAAETLPFYSGGYYEMKDQFDDPKFKNVSDFEKVMYSTLYGVTSAVLEKYGLTKSISKTPFGKSLTSSILSTAIKDLPKDATEQMIKDAVESSVLNKLKSASVNTLGAFVVEASTESAQKVTELALQETFDWIHGNEKEGYDKFKNGTWKDMFVNTLYEGYLGGLGGGVMQIASSSISGITEGLTKTLNKDQIQVLDNMVKIDGMVDSYDSYLKGMVVNGDLTPDEAREMSASFREVKGNFDKIPDNIAPEEKAKAFDLMIERSKIEKEITGKDESLVAPQKARIAEINNELTKISEDATKKSTEQQQEVTAEGGGVQREGAVEGQPEVGQGEGTVGQATEQGTDTSNRPVESRSEEEVKKLRADEQAELTEAIPNIDEYKVDGEIDKASMPEDVLAKYDEIYNKYDAKITPLLSATETSTIPTPVPKIAETTDTKTYSEALSSAKAELKAEGKGLDLQVSDVSQEEADAIVKEGGKIFMTEDGLAGAYVKKDGYMGGLFKSPKATYKEVAKLLQQARIKVGGKFMDAYATELEKIYVNNGFRPIARMKFNEEYAPEGWDAPGSALAGKPDVVFFAYDPEGKYNIGDGQYVEDYDAAYEMAKNFDSKTTNEADKLAELMKGYTVVEGTNEQVDALIKEISDSYIVVAERTILEQVANATKALRAILPNVKFVLHSTDESFREAAGETNDKYSSRGAYDPKNKVVHINLTKANNRTVMHEVFHAIIISKTSSDAKLQSLTKNMVKSVMKSLKQSGANQNVITYLDGFSNLYEDNEQNEEKLSELFALLGETYKSLPYPTQNIIQRFLDRVAKMFGLKEMTDREVVDFMSSLSGKVESGTEITAKEFNGGKKVSKPSEGLTTRKQYGNNKVKIEVRYLEQERMDELIKNGLVQEVNNLSELNGQQVVTTSPDDMLVGSIYVNGKEVAIGNGGIFFVTKFGDVWANSNKGVTKGLASAINESSRSNGGKAYLVLVKGSDAKLVSSPQGVTSSLAVTESMLDAGLFSLSDFRNAIRSAVKKAGGDISLSQNGSAKTLKNELDALFSDVTASTFEKRGNVLRDIISNLVKSKSASENKAEIIKFLNGDISKGLGVGVTDKSQSLVDLIAKVSAEELTKGLNVGDIYGVIEINGEVDVFQDKHQSYPYHIKMVDKDGNVSSEKPVLILPKNRRNGKEILTSIEGQTAEELGTGFSGKVGATANLSYGKGIIQDSNTEVEDKSNIRKQKPLQPEVAEKLTEDGNGNYVFNHYSYARRKTIKPGTGQNDITSREEASALNAVGGLAMFYTMDMQKEMGTGPNQHTVLIPMDRVYYLNKDQDKFYDEAKSRFEKVRPGQAFNANYQVAFITQVANENGYDIVVANWRNDELRAQTTMELTPSDKNIQFKPLKEVTFEVGDTVQIYGGKVKITEIDGTIITFKGETIGGTIDFKRSPKSIQKTATPKAQIEEEVKTLEEEMKPKMKKQHTQKDVKEDWTSTPVQSMRDSVISKRNEQVEDAAKKLTKGEITQKEYVDVRKKYSPINRIGQLFAPASTEHMKEALGKKSDKLMAPVLDENGNKIKIVGIRLDIPSYLNNNAWVVTVHDGRKENGNVISYRNSARLKNVVFSTDPRAALNVAAGYMGKSTFGRIMGEMVEIPGNTAEDQGINAQVMIEEIMNDPSWVQVGMNPFRQSWFWNRETGAPVVSADEVIQIGGLVYAKNAKEVSPDSDEFTVFAKYDETKNKLLASDEALLDSEGNRIRFQRGNKKASKQAAVIVKKGKEANLSDAGIREYMKRNGYTDRQATDAIQAYNDKQEGIFIDPEWSKLRKAAVVFKRKYLLARGLMPNTSFASNESRQAQTAKEFNKAQKILVDFNRGLNKVPKNQREKVRADFDAYVRGDSNITLPSDLKKVADTMRAHIDEISISLINSGLVDEHTIQKIKDNLGSYLTRSYKVYDRANWSKEVEAEIKQKAINFLKVQYTPMAQEIAAKEGMDVDDVLDTIVTNKFNEILTKEGAENFITGGKMGSKNLSILKERQDIPLEIRMLMGEYTDPAQNYAKTILKMSALAANHQFLTEVKKNGTGVFLFEKNDPRRPKGFDYMIAAEGSETMNPLNGMYTTKEIKEEFEKQPAQLGAIMETYMRALSLVKWGKTIGSLMTHAKNVFGNIGFVLLNGHWRVNEMGRAYKTVKNDLFSRDKDGLRDYMNRLIELGIVKQSAGIGELRAMFKDADWDTAMIERINKNTGSRWDWVKSKFSKGTKFMEDLYQSEDDFFKIVAYENELSRYSKAMFGKPKTELTESERTEVDLVVAEIVKNTYPTYSRIPELVNMIRRFPFIGNFISFQAESYRTAFNTAALSLDEIRSKNPGVRQIGAQRLVGSITYLSAKTAILSAFSHAAGMGAVGILGYFTDDEEEKKKEDDVRKFIAPWSKNSDLIILKANNGKLQYIDFSSSDPHGGINKAINSALSGKKTIDGFINALGSTIEPFIGEEMTTAAILAVKNNQNAYGKPIYNPEDTFFEKTKDISAYMLNVVQPGTVSTARKLYESDSKLNEAVGAATGMRIYDVDVSENFGYSMITFGKRIDDANRIYTSEVYKDGATEKSIAAAKARAEKSVTEIHAEIYNLYYSAVRLGADEDKLYDNLKSFGGMTKRTISYMFDQEDFYIKNKYPEEEE